MCFGGGKRQPTAITQDVPRETDPSVQAALEKERELARRRKGRRSTILTGPAGLADGEGGRTLG